MKRHSKHGALLLAGLVLLLSRAAVRADDPILQQKLDRPVDVAISNKPIETVFALLSEATGVSFEVAPDTLAFLPYGSETHLNVTLKEVTLRQALPLLLAPQALQWQVRGDTVVILPSEPLYRLCRRSTYEELLLLGKLMSATLEAEQAVQTPAEVLRAVTGETELKVVLPADLQDDALRDAQIRALQALPGSPAEWLDLLAGEGRTWYLDGKRISVVSDVVQVHRQLQQRISLDNQPGPFVDVLLLLARQGRFKLLMEPGVLNRLPKSTQEQFAIAIEDASIAQVLEVISGVTGLAFPVSADGVNIEATDALLAGDSRPGQGGGQGFIVRTTFTGEDGREREILIPVANLPKALQTALDSERRRVIDEMQRYWAPTGEDSSGGMKSSAFIAPPAEPED